MKCAFEGCETSVSAKKPLCLEHWRAKRDGEAGDCVRCGRVLVESGSNCRACNETYKTERESEAEGFATQVRGSRLSATQIGNEIGLKGYGVNEVLVELGWLSEARNITPLGTRMGGVATSRGGNEFVLWPRAIADNPIFLQTVKRMSAGANGPALMKNLRPVTEMDARVDDRSSTMLRRDSNIPVGLAAGDCLAADGHYVRSQSEVQLDDWLYARGICHAYEALILRDSDIRSDFFLPQIQLHIEFWGMTSPEYLQRKARKKAIYAAHKIAVLDVEPSHLSKLDTWFHEQLRRHGLRNSN